MDMRIGVLDVGSNSAHLDVVDVQAGAPPLPIYALKASTKLGGNIGASGAINDAGAARVVDAVARTLTTARKMNVAQLYPFATAAIRDAANRDQILDAVEHETGLRLQLLTGEQEGRLTYLAVRHWMGWQAGRLLNIDIGGGSMELALGRDAIPDIVISLPLGAGRVSRTYLGVSPVPTGDRVKALRKYVRQQVGSFADRVGWEGRPRRVVVTSKTFKQLARMCGAPKQRHGPFAKRVLTSTDLERCVDRLSRIPVEDRADVPGVSDNRAPQILGGAVVALETMRRLRIEEAELSPWALREGIMLAHLAQVDRTTGPPVRPVPCESTRSLRTPALITTHPPGPGAPSRDTRLSRR
jgi:exopolyphosphatase/guanosine-5'-triphosphate,3'-diphosphate pyrophosphatase